VSLAFLLMYIGTQSEWPGDYLIGVAFGLVGVAACLVVTFLPSRRQAVTAALTPEPNRETVA
jgi:UDP-GlcNAc:undecaprenyl-phosphate/decaprenyl-phosphate GlcNAc-1-phosphate transferase